MPFVLVNFFAFMVSWVIGGLSQAFVVLSEDLDEPIAKIANLLSYCILTVYRGKEEATLWEEQISCCSI